MKRNLNKAVAALLFASAVITWSLTMWATPPAQGGTLGIASMPKTRSAFAVDGGVGQMRLQGTTATVPVPIPPSPE